MRINRSLVELKLGEHYIISWGYGYANKVLYKFIQPTRCGYNFLNEKTSKCILPRHLYPWKKKSTDTKKLFFVHHYMNIQHVIIDKDYQYLQNKNNRTST